MATLTLPLPLDRWTRWAALGFVLCITSFLTFVSIPLLGWQLHFFQLGIFLSAFLFGPRAGAAVGALSSSFVALFVISNPWTIGGNFLLGYFAGRFFPKWGATKSMLLAYAIQLPYLVMTDHYIVGMPLRTVAGIAVTLGLAGLFCAYLAGRLTPSLAERL